LGKSKGRKADRRLVDMGMQPPEPPSYDLPDSDECDEVPGKIVLALGHELNTRFCIWKDRLIVEFAVVQVVRHNGRWVEVARIDTCHASVHKHQLSKSKPDDQVGHKEELKKIPGQSPWTVVNDWYDTALILMQTEWTENLRRWRHG
jgi:hypothetical protein